MRALTPPRRPGDRLSPLRRGLTAGVPAEAIALAADLLAVAVAAGLTPYLALQVAGRFATGAAGSRLEAVLRAAEGGERLADALDAESARTPDLAPLLAVLANSERSGVPAGSSLTRLAVSVRAQARRRAMARARTVPVRLLFPLVFLVLPAFLVLTVAPVVLAGLNH
jgi:tight adherence protein C